MIAQTRRLLELAQAQVSTLFDKRDLVAPNIEKYPLRALQEAIVNAVVHRDYQLSDPLRVTAFHDRIEIVSPGRLPTGVNVESLRAGRATAKWRNQSLAWVFIRLNFAQSEGQGIPTIIRVLQGLGSAPPEFDADEARVTCVVRAHPRFLKLTAPPGAATKPKKKPAIKKKPTGRYWASIPARGGGPRLVLDPGSAMARQCAGATARREARAGFHAVDHRQRRGCRQGDPDCAPRHPLDSLAERLREERVRRIVEPILAGLSMPDVAEDDIRFVRDLGLLKMSETGGLEAANPIYREVIDTWC